MVRATPARDPACPHRLTGAATPSRSECSVGGCPYGSLRSRRVAHRDGWRIEAGGTRHSREIRLGFRLGVVDDPDVHAGLRDADDATGPGGTGSRAVRCGRPALAGRTLKVSFVDGREHAAELISQDDDVLVVQIDDESFPSEGRVGLAGVTGRPPDLQPGTPIVLRVSWRTGTVLRGRTTLRRLVKLTSTSGARVRWQVTIGFPTFDEEAAEVPARAEPRVLATLAARLGDGAAVWAREIAPSGVKLDGVAPGSTAASIEFRHPGTGGIVTVSGVISDEDGSTWIRADAAGVAELTRLVAYLRAATPAARRAALDADHHGA